MALTGQLTPISGIITGPINEDNKDKAARVATQQRLCTILSTTAVIFSSFTVPIGLIGAIVGLAILCASVAVPFILVLIGGLAAIYVAVKLAPFAGEYHLTEVVKLRQKVEDFVNERWEEGVVLKDGETTTKLSKLKGNILTQCDAIKETFSKSYDDFTTARKNVNEYSKESNSKLLQDWQEKESTLFKDDPSLIAYFLQEEKFRALELETGTPVRDVVAQALMLYSLLGKVQEKHCYSYYSYDRNKWRYHNLNTGFWQDEPLPLENKIKSARVNLEKFLAESGVEINTYRDTKTPMRLDLLAGDWLGEKP